MSRRLPSLALLLTLAGPGAMAQSGATPSRVLESFDDASAFRAVPSDGVTLALRGDSGVAGGALRMEFDFQGRAGYVVARRAFSMPPLPSYWAMTLWVRGVAKPNTLELKLVDSSGQNVWWMRRVDLRVSSGWTQLRFRPSDLSFAWGPLGGGAPRGIAALEIAFTAGQGGKGWLALDELTLVPTPPPVADRIRPSVSASSSLMERPAALVLPPDFAIPPDSTTAPDAAGWRSAGDGEQWIELDFGGPRPLSGLVLDWSPVDWAADYDVEASDDGRTWSVLRSVRGSGGGRRFVHLPGAEPTRLRVRLLRSSRRQRYALRAIHILSDSAAATRSAFLERVAQGSAAGSWPRPLTGQQNYWTVVGLGDDDRDALFSEDGDLESRPGSFSVEPFVRSDGRLLTWREGTTTQSLEDGEMPIPTARRHTDDLELATTAAASGAPGRSVVAMRYRLVNLRARPRIVELYAVVRPVQVNPPWQFLGTPGGAARVRSLRWTGHELVVNDSDVVAPLTPVAGVGVARFDTGSVVELLRAGRLPAQQAVVDSTALAEGVLAWRVRLGAHDSADVWIELPDPSARPPGTAEPRVRTAREASRLGEARLTAARAWWTIEDIDGDTRLYLPRAAAELAATMRTAVAHIRINARGPAIQPGTRSYRRSWIRDGALTSSALLRAGRTREAERFLDWYVPFVFPNGKVPCCVDQRGADPVTENDADGELLFLAAEIARRSKSDVSARRHWPTLKRVAGHLDSLRLSRRTAAYATPDSQLVFGLLPPSISHEGYSAKPAYSYWDDWWGVRGLEDAAFLARLAGDDSSVTRYATAGRQMRADVVASVQRSMARHHIATLPGAAELGDLDPTSSTIALDPGEALSDLPRAAITATFDSAWATLQRRSASGAEWEVFTPYEWRDVGALIRLGQPERADAYSTWLMSMRRPREWNQWSEAIWRDPRAPKFIGDMPHGWVASDFIRATLDRFAYERASDSTTVVGAGIPAAWVERDTVRAFPLHTWWGTLEMRMEPIAGGTRVLVQGAYGPGGLEIHAPFGRRPVRATANGVQLALVDDGRAVRVPRSPATVDFVY